MGFKRKKLLSKKTKMSAALFGSIACAVTRAAMKPSLVTVAVAASPRRNMSDDGGKSKDASGTVASAGDSFAKKEKAEEARFIKKMEAEEAEKKKKKDAEKKKDD